MARHLISRLGQAILTVFMMSIVVFLLARLTGNPLDYFLPPYASETQFEAAAIRMGLDQPLWTQYWHFLVRALQGDFGQSLYYDEPSFTVVMRRFPATFQLAGSALAIAIFVAIPLGVVAGSRPQSAVDRASGGLALVGQAVPNFWLGILLIEYLAVATGWFPIGGKGGLLSLVLPAVTMSAYLLAGLLRLSRSATREALTREYITLARAKGASERRIIWKHAFRSALVPVVTFAGIVFAQLLVGSIVVETVFAWPGVGQLAFQAASQRDFPLLQTVVICFTAVFVLMSLVIDMLYVVLDPRVRT